jgi:hypothetical protein
MDNSYIEYIDLPIIPKELLPEAKTVIDLPIWGLDTDGGGFHKSDNKYFTKKISMTIKDWMVENFNFDFVANYVVFNGEIPPHKDMRTSAYNYLIDAGGEDIKTTVWQGYLSKEEYGSYTGYNERITSGDNNLIELQSMIIEPLRWHRLKTEFTHSVNGTYNRPRVMISVTPVAYLPSPKNPETLKKFNVWMETWDKE